MRIDIICSKDFENYLKKYSVKVDETKEVLLSDGTYNASLGKTAGPIILNFLISAYAQTIVAPINEAIIDVGDYSDNNMKEKIKKYKNLKDPFIIVLGDQEAREKTVSINVRGSNKQIQNVPLDDFVAMCIKLNAERTLELPQEV